MFVSKSSAQSPIFYANDGTQAALPFEFVLRADATYRQDPSGMNFTGGQFRLFVRDGLVSYDAPCIATSYLPPGSVRYLNYFGFIIISPPCALGTTGFLSGGDINGDGINDPAAYLAVTQVAPAVLIEPSRPDKIQLVAAPPSLLPRPSGGFSSTSANLFFNIQTTRILQYKMSQYGFNQIYTAGQRQEFDEAIVQGTYRYVFPLVNRPTVPVPVDVNYFGNVDGFREVNNQKRGFKFNGFNFVGGFALIDPSVPNTIRWEGNTQDKIAINSDVTQFRIIRLADETDPSSDALEPDGRPEFVEDPPGSGLLVPNPTFPIFPAFAGPGVTQVTLQNPLETSYTLPPGIIPVGSTGLLQVTIVRNRGAAVADKSRISFSVPVKFQPPGSPEIVALQFIASKLPANASAADKAFNNDFDGDGISNFAEWVFNSDPGKASSVPIAPQLTFESASSKSGISTKNDSSNGNWVYRVSKRENSDPALEYAIERSVDMNEWIKVTKDDPNWELIESPQEIKVISRTQNLNGGNFFRGRAVEAGK